MPAPGPVAEVETVPPPTPGVGPALKPKERSSVARPPAAAEDEEDATQSAKAPVSEGSLLLVATTANSSAN